MLFGEGHFLHLRCDEVALVLGLLGISFRVNSLGVRGNF